MTRTILVAAAALASISLSPRHATASEAPWCAVYSRATKPGAGTASIARSKSAARTLAKRGWCNPSPYYVGPPDAEHRRPLKRRARPQ